MKTAKTNSNAIWVAVRAAGIEPFAPRRSYSFLNVRRNDRMALISLTLSAMSTSNYAASLSSNPSAWRIALTSVSASLIMPSSFSLIPARQRYRVGSELASKSHVFMS